MLVVTAFFLSIFLSRWVVQSDCPWTDNYCNSIPIWRGNLHGEVRLSPYIYIYILAMPIILFYFFS